MIDQMVVLPFRGIFRGWRNVLVRSLMRLSKGKCTVLPLGRSSLRHQDRLGTDSLQSILEEKALGVLLDTKLTTSQQHAFMAKVATSLVGCITQSIASRLKEVITPLCSALVRHMGAASSSMFPSTRETWMY